MQLASWADVLTTSFQSVLFGILNFLPDLLVAIIIFVVGWLIGTGLGKVITQVINSLRVDQALRSAGVERVLERAGFTLNSGGFVGVLVKWFFVVVFLVAALDVLKLTEVTVFLREVVLGYLPQVIVAVLIILAAAVIADVAQKVVSGAAKAAHLKSANLAGTIARWAIWIFAILIALDRLGVSPLIQTLFTGVVVALSLAFGLAFGLGGQQAAARYIEKVGEDMR